jgi:von Willebrand factor type A domain
MRGRFGEVREASKNVVDGLRDKRSEVTVVGFATNAAVITSAVDVSDQDARQGLKRTIDGLDADGGATNWAAAMDEVYSLDLDLAVMITDGVPTALGNPARDGVYEQEPLAAAATAADRLKRSGTRIVAVGIELQPGADRNLAMITGPDRGKDFYPSESADLLQRLYEIVASACGVSITALPAPEPASFPLLETIVGAFVALLLLMLAGYLLRRRRGGLSRHPSIIRPSPRAIPDPTIYHHDIRLDPPQPGTTQPRPAGRSMSLDFLREQQPPSKDPS